MWISVSQEGEYGGITPTQQEQAKMGVHGGAAHGTLPVMCTQGCSHLPKYARCLQMAVMLLTQASR